MTELASLSVAIDSDPVLRFKKALEELTAAGPPTEWQASKITEEYKRTARELAGTTKATYDLVDAEGKLTERAKDRWASLDATSAKTAELTKETQRLMDRYDPLGTKLRALVSEQAAFAKAMEKIMMFAFLN